MTEYTYQWNPEWEDDPSMPQLKVTKSSLNTFEFCRKQYEFNYIEGRKQEPSMAMIKGTIVHNSYEDFYNQFEIKKAEELDENSVYEYCMGLFPIDDYGDIYQTMAAFETERFVQARKEEVLETFLPVGNEIRCNAKLLIPRDCNPKFTLRRDYTVHIQGIIDRVFQESSPEYNSECDSCWNRIPLKTGKLPSTKCKENVAGSSDKCRGELHLIQLEKNSIIPVELKTGAWKDRKQTHMRNEMAFYKVLMDADPDCDLGPVTHWAWYYPDSNYFQLEEVKNRNVNNIIRRIAKLIYAYEQGIFPTSYYPNKCQYCAYVGICDSAQQAELWEW